MSEHAYNLIQQCPAPAALHDANSIVGPLHSADLPSDVVAEIERNEGCVLHSYRDCVGVWTIGYGHTGPDVHPGQTITREEAELLLNEDLNKFSRAVVKLLVDHPFTDHQFGAMVSLAYNIGVGNFHRSSVLRYHNQQDFKRAADAFLLWDKAGGRVLPGLVRRRHEERALYLTPDA